MQDGLTLKGIREGVLVTVNPEQDWPSTVSALITRIDNQASFFKGATLVLQLLERSVQRHELERLVNLLTEREVVLAGVLSTSAVTQGATRQLGIAVDLAEVRAKTVQHRIDDFEQTPTHPERLFDDETEGAEAVLIRRTLRSGRVVRNPGHVIVIGDVNPGAQVIAGGDIIVWGKVRGIVHAGAMGDENCVICALDLQPTQLRIGSIINVSPPQKGKRRKPRPEIARVRDGHIEAEEWSYK
ncbi:MAG: septum site-determining protein MinC [Phototrophicales bacterium]|nr:MAG: septum site-determining protein MinC [Phototrophicales bacterium]